MSTFKAYTDDYLKNKKKKKAENTSTKNKSFKEYTESVLGVSLDDDIAPVKTTTTLAPAKKEEEKKRTWFNFNDNNTAKGTISDIGEDLLAGIVAIPEKLAYAFADIAPVVAKSQYMSNPLNFINGEKANSDLEVLDKMEKELDEFARNDWYDEGAVAREILSNAAATSDIYNKTMNNQAVTSEDWKAASESKKSVKSYLDNQMEIESILGDKSDSAIQSAGQVLATKGLTKVGVPWQVTTGLTSFGSEYNNALNQGATKAEANMSAAISAGAEILSENLGGISYGGKTITDKWAQDLSINISNRLARSAIKLGLDFGAEGAEEVFSSLVSNIGSKAYKDEKMLDILFNDEALHEYSESFLAGGILGGGSSVVGAVNSAVKGTDVITDLTANEKAVVDKFYKDLIAEQETDGKKLSSKEKKALYDSSLTALEKGYIDIDTIESVLGGENYKTYKTITEQETALKKEYDTLNKMKPLEMTGEQTDRRLELKRQLADYDTTSNKSQIREQLSKDMLGLVRGSKLSESYNEKSRRSQVFEADLTKYDAKQQEVVKKAMESGVLNNTNRTHDFVDMVAKISAEKGVLFDFTNNAKLKESGFALDGKTINGLVQGNNISLNIDSAKSLNTVVGHEITHVLEGTELYSELQSIVKEYAKGEYDTRYQALSELYEEGTDIDAEVTADLIGDILFTDSDFVNKLSVDKPNVFKRIYNEIKYLYKVATAGSKEQRELEKVKRAFEKAYRESGNTSGDVKYSVSDKNIKDISVDYSYGETLYRMSYMQDGKEVGSLQYGEYDGEPNVKMIEVKPEYRRKGIGTKLLQELQNKYPDTEIEFGMSTPDGTKLLDSVTYDVTDEAVVADRQKLKDLQTELDELQEKLDVFYEADTLTEAEMKEFDTVGDRWNEVYDAIRNLNESLRDKKATKRFVKTDTKYSLSDSDIRYSLSGVNAKTANSSMLLTAEHMLNAGADSETVRKETGWYKGYDGKMRFEIDDSKSELIENPNLESHEDEDGTIYFSGKLSDILNHSDLYEAYPQLRNVNIVIQPTEAGISGIYQPNSNYITLDIELFKRFTKEYSELLDVAEEEIKRIEQTPEFKEYNKWYEDEELSKKLPAAKWLEEEKKAQDKFFSSELGKRYYFLKWGRHNTKNIKKTEFGWSKQAKAVLMHEVQHAVQKIENFASGSSEAYWQRVLKNGGVIKSKKQQSEYKEVRDKYYEILNKNPDFFYEMTDLLKSSPNMPRGKFDFETGEQIEDDPIEWQEFDKNRDALEEKYGTLEVFDFIDLDYKLKQLRDESLTASEAYYNTAGEIEARDVEKRLNMTAEQRVNKRPDIDNANVVFAANRYSLSATDKEKVSSRNEEYISAVQSGDLDKARRILNSVAREIGYTQNSDYQGTSAFNGTAPCNGGWYDTKEEAVAAWEEGSFEGDWSLADTLERGIDNGDLFYHLGDRNYRFVNSLRKEAIANLRKTVSGKKATIKMYRSVPSYVKENMFRNGDWITPSKSYAIDNAEIHGWGDNYRIIEQEVSTEDVWWDGNDIAEWGYDNGNEYEVYKNTPNNVKLLDVTYDDNGNVIPLSERFNTENPDIRYSLSHNDISPTKSDPFGTYGKDIALEGTQKELERTQKELKKNSNEVIEELAPLTEEQAALRDTAQNNERFFLDDIGPEPEAPYYGPQEKPSDPFSERDIKEVGKKNVKAYMYENPEVKPYFQEEAQLMLNDLNNSQKGTRYFNDKLYYDTNGEMGYFGTQRFTSDEISYLLDTFNYSYGDIEKGLKAIIEDNGKENNAVSKRIEFLLDERLRLGYEYFMTGDRIPPNQEYLELLKSKQITDYSDESWNNWLMNLSENDIEQYFHARENDVAPVTEVNREVTAPLYDAQPRKGVVEGQQSMFEEAEGPQTITRSVLHNNIVNDMKSAFEAEGYNLDDVLKKAKNLSTWSTVDNTPQRVMEKSLGYKQGKVLSDLTVNKVAQNETAGIRWLNNYLDRKKGLVSRISKQYNIKPGSKKSAAAQMYAEGFYVNDNNQIIKYGDAELAKDFPDINVRNDIIGLANDPRIRQIYDDTLDKINESRKRNAYPEIPRLDNYYLHFRAMTDTFSRLGLPFNPNDIRAKDLPTDLNGVTADLKPGQPYFSSAMHRRGQRTSFDLLGGLERYLTSAKNQIYHIDDIQNFRALRNYIADTYGQAQGLENLDTLSEEEAQARIKEVYDSHLSTFAKFLNEEANILAGKTALIDRGLEGIIGRRGITFLDTVNKQVGSNMVGLNISSSLTNFLPVAQTFAKSNKLDFVKAFAQTTSNKIGSIFGKNDGFADNSPVMIRRKGADRFYRTPFQKIADTGYVLMSAVDDISTELITRTKYNELTRKGMDTQKAHYETDKWVSRLMGDRSLGQQPQLYNSKMLGLVTKFQLEVRNQLDSQFYDTIQEAKVSNEYIQNGLQRNAKTAAKVASTFVQLAVVQHLFGKAFESVAGYNPAFDIIEVLIKAFGFDDEEDSEDTVLDNVEQGFLTLLEDLPYTSTLTGGRIPISTALPIEELVTGKDEYGNDKSRWETLGEIAPYYVMPTGYGQLKKTVQGLNMFSDEHPVSGSYTDSGNLRFPIEDTLANRVQAGIFGQWASENARDYFDNERNPLKEKQIEEYKDLELPIRDYWEYREGLAKQDSLEDKFDYISGLDVSVEQKNIMINNVVDRKDKVDMTNYDDFANYEEFDFYSKNEEKYNFLQDNGISYTEYKSSDETKEEYDNIYSWYKNNPEKVTVSKAVTDNVIEYKRFTGVLNDIKADKDENGDSISGSAKAKKIDYINELDLDYGQKIILFRTYYSSKEDKNTYNPEIVEYLNNREDIFYEDMVTILEELGMKVHSDGTVTW